MNYEERENQIIDCMEMHLLDEEMELFKILMNDYDHNETVQSNFQRFVDALEDAEYLGKVNADQTTVENLHSVMQIFTKELEYRHACARGKVFYKFEGDGIINAYNMQGDYLGMIDGSDNLYDWSLIVLGADPIEEKWEDGAGNTLSLDGWSNE